MKLIMLDIDGVLHPLVRGLNASPYNWDMAKKDPSFLHPDKVELIIELARACSANIVISSAWRADFSVDQFNEVFAGLVVGKTPHAALDGRLGGKGKRLQEVRQFLDAYPEPVSAWVAIDDQADHYPDIDNFIHTDANVGITYDLAEKAKRMLGVHETPTINSATQHESGYRCRLCGTSLSETGNLELCACGAIGLNKKPGKDLYIVKGSLKDFA